MEVIYFPGHYPVQNILQSIYNKTTPIFGPRLQSLISSDLYPLPRLNQDVRADRVGDVVSIHSL